MRFQALRGKRAGPGDGVFKTPHTARVGCAGDTAKKPLVVEKVIAGEDALEKEFLEKITGGERNLTERLLGMVGSPVLKDIASFGKLLHVQEAVTLLKFWDRGESGPSRNGSTGARAYKEQAQEAGEEKAVDSLHERLDLKRVRAENEVLPT